MSDISFPHSLEMFSICPLFTHVFFLLEEPQFEITYMTQYVEYVEY